MVTSRGAATQQQKTLMGEAVPSAFTSPVNRFSQTATPLYSRPSSTSGIPSVDLVGSLGNSLFSSGSSGDPTGFPSSAHHPRLLFGLIGSLGTRISSCAGPSRASALIPLRTVGRPAAPLWDPLPLPSAAYGTRAALLWACRTAPCCRVYAQSMANWELCACGKAT